MLGIGGVSVTTDTGYTILFEGIEDAMLWLFTQGKRLEPRA